MDFHAAELYVSRKGKLRRVFRGLGKTDIVVHAAKARVQAVNDAPVPGDVQFDCAEAAVKKNLRAVRAELGLIEKQLQRAERDKELPAFQAVAVQIFAGRAKAHLGVGIIVVNVLHSLVGVFKVIMPVHLAFGMASGQKAEAHACKHGGQNQQPQGNFDEMQRLPVNHVKKRQRDEYPEIIAVNRAVNHHRNQQNRRQDADEPNLPERADLACNHKDCRK